MEQVRFGMIGCGDVTEVKSAPALKKIAGASLDMVMCRNPDRVKDYARRHGVPGYTTDYLELLKNPNLDVIYIATPPDSHAFYTIEAARHGKAVYVEKPMALTVKEAKSMREACAANNVPLFVAYYRRGQPKFLKAKEVLDNGLLGEIAGFQYLYACPKPTLDPSRAWLMDPKKAGGGLLYDIGSHMMNAICFLLGDPLSLQCFSAKEGRGDQHSAILRFDSGVQGTMELCFRAGVREDQLLILGSRGSMRLSIMSNDLITLEIDGKLSQLSFDPIPHVQQPYIQQIVNTLMTGKGLEATGAEGLLTQELIEAMDQGISWLKNDRKREQEG